MSILKRIYGTETPRIPVHQFMAALGEYKRGSVTANQIVDGLNLNATEATNLNEWLAGLDNDTIDRQLIHDVLLLLEAQLYTIAKAKTRLGITND